VKEDLENEFVHDNELKHHHHPSPPKEYNIRRQGQVISIDIPFYLDKIFFTSWLLALCLKPCNNECVAL
jgi:hypothetical protein